MKGIIRGGRCNDGDHKNQPFDNDDAATSTTTTGKGHLVISSERSKKITAEIVLFLVIT
jgi:hypothetical protein